MTDPEVRAKLRAVAHNQSQVTDSSHLAVFAVRTNLDKDYVAKYIDHIAKARGLSLENLAAFQSRIDDFVDNPPVPLVQWATCQVYIALGVFLATAANLEIDACPMEGFLPRQFDEILQLDRQQLRSVVVAAAGYRSTKDPFAALKKVGFETSDLFVHV